MKTIISVSILWCVNIQYMPEICIVTVFILEMHEYKCIQDCQEDTQRISIPYSHLVCYMPTKCLAELISSAQRHKFQLR